MSTDDDTGAQQADTGAQQAESEEELVPIPLLPLLPGHEELEVEIFRRIIMIGDLTAATDAKVDQLMTKVNHLTSDVARLQSMLVGLARMTAKTPEGESLINVVMNIRAKVEKL
jgi:hypothetical protein